MNRLARPVVRSSVWRGAPFSRVSISKCQQRFCSSSKCPPQLCHRLVDRGLVRVAGQHAASFLQGLVTNDIRCLESACHTKVLYAMMLNIQGRVLYDLIVYHTSKELSADDNEVIPEFYVECDAEIIPEFLALLKRYKLRKKVELSDLSSSRCIWAVSGSPTEELSLSVPANDIIAHKDPRLSDLGHRVILPHDVECSSVVKGCENASPEDYLIHRYKLGVGEGTTDLPPGACLPLEANAVFLNGVSFSKGCYIGQELTARTHHTGVIRKRLMPITLEDESADVKPGDSIVNADNKTSGKLRGSCRQHGLALLRIADVVGKGPLLIQRENKNGDKVTVAECEAHVPDWWPQDSDKVVKGFSG